MKKVTQVDRLAEQCFLLYSLHPVHHVGSLLAQSTEPSTWVLWSFPLLLPTGWHHVFEQSCSFLLDLWSEHFRALEDLDNTLHALMNKTEDAFNCNHLHKHELVHRIRCPHVVACDFHALEQAHVENIAPKLANRAQLLGPLVLVKAELLCTDSLKVLQARNDLV